MMRSRFGTALFFLLNAAGLRALDVSGDTYGSLQDFFSDLYGGIDENAGLTAFPVLNIPMGGRSEGMAGAFAAVCDDISFIEWNPAGSSMLNKTEMAFYHNNWIADTKIETGVFATKLGRVGAAVAGKWLYTPFSEYDAWGERASKGHYSEAVGMLNFSYTFFAGYYFPGISLGVNIKGAYRSTPDFAAYSSASQSAMAFVGDAGLLTRVNLLKFYDSREKNMSFAVVARNFGPPVLDEALPAVAVAAVAWKPFRPLLISFDFSYPVNILDFESSEKQFYSVGLSLAVTSFLSMRAGVLIRAGAPRATMGSSITIGSAAVEVNYTLDLATQLQPLNRITVGVRLDLGDGGAGERARLVDTHYLNGLEYYTNGEQDKALSAFGEALKLDPSFDPAREGINAIKNHRVLTDRIEQLEQID